MTDDTKQRLHEMCLSIAKQVEKGDFEREDNQDEEYSVYDWLSERTLDIEYTISGKGDYLGASVLVCFGGPNIWIDTRHQQVKGAWGFDSVSVPYFEDGMGLDDACEELFSCLK